MSGDVRAFRVGHQSSFEVRHRAFGILCGPTGRHSNVFLGTFFWSAQKLLLRIGYLRAKRRKAATQRNAPCTCRKPRSTSTVQKKAVRAAKGLDGPNPARRSRGLDSDPALGQQERFKRFYSGARINLIHCGKTRPPAEKTLSNMKTRRVVDKPYLLQLI